MTIILDRVSRHFETLKPFEPKFIMPRCWMVGLPNNMTLLCVMGLVFFLMFQENCAEKNKHENNSKMRRFRNRTITFSSWLLQLCIGLCIVSRIADCEDLSSSSEEKSSNSEEDDGDDRRKPTMLEMNDQKCVKYGTDRYKLYCDLCSIDHDVEEEFPVEADFVKISKCSGRRGVEQFCLKNALTATAQRTLKPVCGRKGGLRKWYCGFCSLQKAKAALKAETSCESPSNCGGEQQGPDVTTTVAPDKTDKAETYQYVKRYCVDGKDDTTCEKCDQKSPSFKVKMPVFLEEYMNSD